MPKKNVRRQVVGLFAGTFSSARGDWVPMRQLRRMTSTAAWMLCFGSAAYGLFTRGPSLKHITPPELLCLLGGFMVIAAGSFLAFLWLGSRVFQGETSTDETSAGTHDPRTPEAG